MSPARRPPVAVVLLAPALDTGMPAGAAVPDPRPSAARGRSGDDGSPPGGDALAVAVGAGSFERRPLDAWPWEARLMTALGLLEPDTPASVAGSSVPIARLLGPDDLVGAPHTLAGDVAAAAAAGRLVIADPVSLMPGRDEATLTPPEALATTPIECDALIGAANALLADDGIVLVRGASGRCYLVGLDATGLDTLPAHFLARREAGAHLPASGEAAPWRRLMTELQMLWYAHPVNDARLADDAPPINGLWFWGGAAVPDAPSSPTSSVVSGDAFALALARHAGAPIVSAGTFDEALAATTGEMLLVVDTDAYSAWLANDAAALEAARARCTETWLVPAARAVIECRAASLVVAGGDGGERVFVPPPRRSWLARLFAARGVR